MNRGWSLRRPGILYALLVAVGVSGGALVLLKELWPSLLGGLCLAGWATGEFLRILWEDFRVNPEEGFPQIGHSPDRALFQDISTAFNLRERLSCHWEITESRSFIILTEDFQQSANTTNLDMLIARQLIQAPGCRYSDLMLMYNNGPASLYELALAGPGIRERLKKVAALEQEQAPGAAAFFNATFSAVPALLLGFLCREGSSLVGPDIVLPAAHIEYQDAADPCVCPYN